MTTPIQPATPAVEKLSYIPTSRSEIDVTLQRLGRRKRNWPSQRSEFKQGDVMRLRAFVRWALATGYFRAGEIIDTFGIIAGAESENEEWKTDEAAGVDVVRVAGVLEGLVWVDYKTLKKAVVIWPAPPR